MKQLLIVVVLLVCAGCPMNDSTKDIRFDKIGVVTEKYDSVNIAIEINVLTHAFPNSYESVYGDGYQRHKVVVRVNDNCANINIGDEVEFNPYYWSVKK